MNTPPLPSWCPKHALMLIIMAGLLYVSWAFHPSVKAMWDTLDHKAFLTLNGSLNHQSWALFWAFCNTRMFDVLYAISIALIIGSSLWRVDLQKFHEKSLTLAAVTVCAVPVFFLIADAIDFDRHSPSLSVTPFIDLREVAPDLSPKVSSTRSFPGNHGTVSLVMSFCLLYFGIVRNKILITIVILLNIFPRLLAGAHWLTDILIGSLSVFLASIAVLCYTPLVKTIFGLLKRIYPIHIIEALHAKLRGN